VKLTTHQLVPRLSTHTSIRPLPHTSSWHSAYLNTEVTFTQNYLKLPHKCMKTYNTQNHYALFQITCILASTTQKSALQFKISRFLHFHFCDLKNTFRYYGFCEDIWHIIYLAIPAEDCLLGADGSAFFIKNQFVLTHNCAHNTFFTAAYWAIQHQVHTFM
jgi:hypothetical protein